MLPDWPDGTVTILCTGGEAPHAIPVSAAVRAGPRQALIALAAGRKSLERLRANDRVALLIIAKGTAITAHGQARVVEEAGVEGVVPVMIEVERVQDHDRPTLEIFAGVSWRWTDPKAATRDGEVRAALAELAQRLMRDPPA